MSQLPPNENQLGTRAGSRAGAGQNHTFWISGIGGFVLGALTVIIVLLLARRTGDRDEVGQEARPAPQAVQDAAGN